MKVTLTTNEIAHRLFDDKDAGWTRDGAEALAEYLEQLEADTGEEMEFDCVAIRCDYDEYSSAVEAASAYSWEPEEDDDEDAREKSALSYLRDNTTVIEFNGGVIIQAF